jgi:putative ABC transport system permease protein
MFRNYFNIAWRNLLKNKLYSFINIGGLAVGLSVCMLILLYVAHEMSFDRFHKNAGRIFYPVMSLKPGDKDISIDRMSFETGPILKNSDPGLESYLRVKEITDNRVIENVASPEKKFTERNIVFADANFFDFFSFHLAQGDKKHVLMRPFTMVISQKAAVKYFGNVDPVGKLLKYDGQHTFEITGIVADPPSNSSIHYDFIASMSSMAGMKDENPSVSSGKVDAGEFKTFLLLSNATKASASAKILQRLAGMTEGKFSKFTYSLNALVDRHKDFDNPANRKYLKIFSWVAALILFLALMNYMSLATAGSAIRAKEVGVRKVLGADRSKIIKQFYIESGLYAVIAFLLAVLLFIALRPAFYNLLQLNVDDTFSKSPYALGIFTGLFLITVFISGSYPSLVLSSFKPVKVLYGKLSKQRGGAFVRKFFTILQFTISVTLIISSVIINRQLDFFRNMDTGIRREHIVMIPFQKNMSPHYLAFKRSVENTRGVESVSIAAAPMYGPIDMAGARFGNSGANVLVSAMYVDQFFIKMLGMRWKRPPVDEQQITANGQVVINEEMALKLGLPADPVGQEIVVGSDSLKIAGMLKNFNFSSLHHKIEPLCLFVLNDADTLWYADNGDCLFVKISPHANIPTLLESIRTNYDRLDKQTPFEFRFVDDAFDAQYRAETRLSKVFEVFTIITVFIACLGLFGLAAFSASQRTKEIGIRKVLGADVMNIVTIVAGNFIKPVFISILIAIPLAWVFMSNWLQDFAYRTTISAWIFVLAALIALVIAVATVSFHAIKAAIANPVKSLRSE